MMNLLRRLSRAVGLIHEPELKISTHTESILNPSLLATATNSENRVTAQIDRI
jgi:hypothetical protein